jgi:hypothetical protein
MEGCTRNASVGTEKAARGGGGPVTLRVCGIERGDTKIGSAVSSVGEDSRSLGVPDGNIAHPIRECL